MTFNGDVDQLIGTIQKKTGEAREKIEQFFDEFSSDASAAMNHTRENVRATANQAVNCAQEASHQAVAAVRDSYAEVNGMVRRHPYESLMVCVGCGLSAGLAVSLFLRSR